MKTNDKLVEDAYNDLYTCETLIEGTNQMFKRMDGLVSIKMLDKLLTVVEEIVLDFEDEGFMDDDTNVYINHKITEFIENTLQR